MEIAAFYQNQHDAFLSHYLMAANTGEEEAIHEMRVAFKKIYALSSFLRNYRLLDRDLLCYLKQVRKLFRVAGALRDTQIRLQLLREHQDRFRLPAYEETLHKNLYEAMRLWKHKASSFSPVEYIEFKVKLQHRLSHIPSQHLKDCARKFILKKIRILEALLNQINWQEELHPVRIRLKQMHRIYQLYQATESFVTTQQIKTIELRLGRWHDYLITLQDLHQHIEEVASENYQKAVSLLQSELEELARPVRRLLLLEFSYLQMELRHPIWLQ